MKKFNIPEKRKRSQFLALGPEELKKEFAETVKKLKENYPNVRWNQNNAMLEGIRLFIQEAKKSF